MKGLEPHCDRQKTPHRVPSVVHILHIKEIKVPRTCIRLDGVFCECKVAEWTSGETKIHTSSKESSRDFF